MKNIFETKQQHLKEIELLYGSVLKFFQEITKGNNIASKKFRYIRAKKICPFIVEILKLKKENKILRKELKI